METEIKKFNPNIKIWEARILVNALCHNFKLPLVVLNTSDNKRYLGLYHKANIKKEACIDLMEENIFTLLHELAHHLEAVLYEQTAQTHGTNFQKAKNRVTTWARKNISNHIKPWMLNTYQ